MTATSKHSLISYYTNTLFGNALGLVETSRTHSTCADIYATTRFFMWNSEVLLNTQSIGQSLNPCFNASIQFSMPQSVAVIQSNFPCFTLNGNNSVLLHCLSSEPDNSHLKASHPTPHTTYFNRTQQFSKTGSRISKAQCIFAMLESFGALSLSHSLSLSFALSMPVPLSPLFPSLPLSQSRCLPLPLSPGFCFEQVYPNC